MACKSANPSGSELSVVDAARRLQPQLTVVGDGLKYQNVQIYVFRNAREQEQYLALKLKDPRGIGGLTIPETRISAALTEVIRGVGTSPNGGLGWTIIHELGHQLDWTWQWTDSQLPSGWPALQLKDTSPNSGINKLKCIEVFLNSTCVRFNAFKPIIPGQKNWEIFLHDPEKPVYAGDGYPTMYPSYADVTELMPEIFAATENAQFLGGLYVHPFETIESGEGELRKAYSNFVKGVSAMRRAILQGRP